MTLGLPVSTMYAFLLVLARIGGLIALLPLPAIRSAPMMFRAMLAFAMTIALLPAWPQIPNMEASIGQLTVWASSEMGFGLVAGLAVSLLAEGFQVGAQVLGMPAGFGFAQTIDPNSQADSGVLQVVTMLITGLLFFSLGLDGAILRILAASFQKYPAGSFSFTAASMDILIHLGAGMLSLGLRLALPVVALLLLIDVALALLGRMQQQLQLLSFAFPVKMIAAIGLLAALAPLMPKLFSSASSNTIAALWRLAGF
ncbi:MAG TPA: flagellar biosynthetic protein FliR [Bryobacteraceae bacterium]|nr:flagellar biosynthetic protein FliR [Bryobacteraceae bacterium]